MDKLPLILVGGKGGVGKSTVACALACDHAARGPVHLLSTDPAHSIVEVLGGDIPEGLTIETLDADALLARFRDETRAPLTEIALRGTLLKAEHVTAALEQGVPGHDELMAILRLDELISSGTPVIVDTAPTGHTLRLLDTPAQLEHWVDALDALLEKHRYLRSRFGQAGPDDLDRFLGRFRDIGRRVQALFQDGARCGFLVVTLDEAVVRDETSQLEEALEARGIRRIGTVINRATRPGPWSLPTQPEEPVGARRLARLWEQLGSHWDISPSRWGDVRVFGEAPAGVFQRPWTWFVGKGGVGKTTLACAAALGLADLNPQDAILLLSTDPAHSLAAALGREVGPTPSPIYGNLEAAALDPVAELAGLRAAHRVDLEALFGATMAAGFDPTFDRAVLERLLDLAPPGIDEVMALARAARLAASGTYRHVVVDTAPTGHFLRLLALPEVLDHWLKWAFGVLLDHPEVRLPRLSSELVRRSRELKAFRTLLADASRSGVVVVERPGVVVCAETDGLIQDTRALGAHPVLRILNLAPAPPKGEHADPPRIGVSAGSPPVGVNDLLALGRTMVLPEPRSQTG